jgi:hypothetical protein
MHLANDRDRQIPEALDPVVAGVAWLHGFFGHYMSHFGDYVKRDPHTGKITKAYPQKVTAEPSQPSPLLSTSANQAKS